MRTFLIYYPISNLFDTQEVHLQDGESAIDAIIREGGAWEEWEFRGEVIPYTAL